ncbi:MAG: protein kinase [Polyangiaceae bacterium]|nr:protein kinase [Polyangiaceae bacterium]
MATDDRSNPKTALGGFNEPSSRTGPVDAPALSGCAARTLESAHAAHAAVALTGKVVAGRYRITRLLGEGGMGTVWEAEHVTLKKRVAVKLVNSVHANHPEVAARFKREALATSVIESDHVVQVHDVGADTELGLFMIMELLQGEDLARLLMRERRLDAFAASCLVAQAATALSKGHRSGIVHRDIKPANLFLARRDDGSVLVKILDFGIAKFVHDAESQRSGQLTRIGRAIGTAQYMSPEQAQGAITLDARSDVYSLGAVLYETVSGEPLVPDLASYEQMIIRVLTQPLPDLSAKLSGHPPGFASLVQEMLAKQPDERLPDMTSVVSRILALFPQALDARVCVAEAMSEGDEEGGRLSRADVAPRVPIGGKPGAVFVQRSTRLGLGTSAGVTHEPAREVDVPQPDPSVTSRARRARIAALTAFGAISMLGVVAAVSRIASRGGASPGAVVHAQSVRPAAARAPEPVPSPAASAGAEPDEPVDTNAEPRSVGVGPADAGPRIHHRVTTQSPRLRERSSKPTPEGTTRARPGPASAPRTGTAGVSEEF